MIRPLLKLDIRKTLPYYPVVLAAFLIAILFTPQILHRTNITIIVVALVQGWLLAWRIFGDPPDTRSFLFSRSWLPVRIFWNRWALGMGMQIFTIALIYVILASGTRSLIYHTRLPYFPMVERFELSILWPIALASFITFHIIMFLMLRTMVLGSLSTWESIFVKLLILLLILMPLAFSKQGGSALHIGDLALIYTVILMALCTAASRHCYKNLEIES